MSDDLYRFLSTGLLAVIVLLLLLAVAKLGRLQRSGDMTTPRAAPDTDAPTSTATETAGTVVPVADEPVHETPQAVEPEPEREPEPVVAAESAAPDEEGPYEHDGRWWFRRGGELLVFDESKEEWVDATTPQTSAEPAGDVTSAPAPIGDEPAAAPVLEDELGAPAVEPEVHPLDEARGWDTRPQVSAQPPIVEPVSAPTPITETAEVDTSVETTQNGGSAAETPSHWKCPSCGVINGSTATTCRMCFSARP